MAEKQVRKQKGMLSRLLRIGRHRSHRNVDNTANDDGSAQSAELASNRIGRCAGGVDEARWMPPASTEHDSASTRQQPAQRYPRDVARIASSSKTNEDGDETQDSDAATASSSSESDMLDDIDRKITRLLEQMDAQQEKIKNLEAQVQQERAEKDQLQMQNAQLKSDLQRARVKKGNVREESIKTLTSRTIELQKTCDQMTQVMARKEMEFRGDIQKIREEMKELKKQKKQYCQSKEHQTIINEVSQLRKQMQKARDDSQRTSDATEQKKREKMKKEFSQQNAGEPSQIKQAEMVQERLKMPRLHEFWRPEHLDRALRLTDNIPHMLPVCWFVKVLKRNSSRFIRLFGYPSNNPIVWFGVIPSWNNLICIYVWTNPLESIAEEVLKNAIKQFSECYEIERGNIGIFSPSTLSDKVIQFCNELTEEEWECVLSSQLFYMKEEQQKSVTQMKLELPSHYRFDHVNPSSDARIAVEQDDRIEVNEANIEVIRERFECMPCVAVRSGNKLTSVGVSTPLTIYPFSSPPDEVFTVLEMRVCQECISKTFWPFELIDADNKDWLKCYNDSSLWTHLDGADGKPIIVNMIC